MNNRSIKKIKPKAKGIKEAKRDGNNLLNLKFHKVQNKYGKTKFHVGLISQEETSQRRKFYKNFPSLTTKLASNVIKPRFSS